MHTLPHALIVSLSPALCGASEHSLEGWDVLFDVCTNIYDFMLYRTLIV